MRCIRCKKIIKENKKGKAGFCQGHYMLDISEKERRDQKIREAIASDDFDMLNNVL